MLQVKISKIFSKLQHFSLFIRFIYRSICKMQKIKKGGITMKKFLAGIVSFALVAGTFASQVNSAAETADAPETGKQYQEKVLKGVRGRDIQMSVDKSGKFSANITFLTDHDCEGGHDIYCG